MVDVDKVDGTLNQRHQAAGGRLLNICRGGDVANVKSGIDKGNSGSECDLVEDSNRCSGPSRERKIAWMLSDAPL